MRSECDASPIAAVLIEKEANRILAKKKKLEAVRALVVSAKLPACTFIVDRRLKDVERNKECLETDAGKSIQAILQSAIRLEQTQHYNVRAAANKAFMRKKAEKKRKAGIAAATKKRLFIFRFSRRKK